MLVGDLVLDVFFVILPSVDVTPDPPTFSLDTTFKVTWKGMSQYMTLSAVAVMAPIRAPSALFCVMRMLLTWR